MRLSAQAGCLGVPNSALPDQLLQKCFAKLFQNCMASLSHVYCGKALYIISTEQLLSQSFLSLQFNLTPASVQNPHMSPF